MAASDIHTLTDMVMTMKIMSNAERVRCHLLYVDAVVSYFAVYSH